MDNQTTELDDVVLRSQVMWLIEQAIKNSSDDDPPRHVLSVLWGKVRDLTGANTLHREQMDQKCQTWDAING